MTTLNMPLPFLNGLTAEEFMRDYWQRKPLLVRNAFPNFQSPITPEELAGLSLEEELESRIIIEHGNTPWELLHGPFDEQTFHNLPETHWTLLVQAVDQFLPEVAALYKPFEFIPKWRFDDIMISYSPKGGTVGPHFDYYDVFLIQAQGQRCWKIGAKENSQSPLLDHPDLRLLAHFEQTEEWIVNPGDLLYLPPQFAHYGIAENDCMTISVGLRSPSSQEVLVHYSDFASQFLTDDEGYRDPEQTAVASSSFIDANVLPRLRGLLEEALKHDDKLIAWFGQYMTEPRYPDLLSGEELEPNALLELLANGAVLQACPCSKFAWTLYNDKAIIFAAGFSHSFDKAHAEALQVICESEQLNQACLQPWLSDDTIITLLIELIKQGSLEFCND